MRYSSLLVTTLCLSLIFPWTAFADYPSLTSAANGGSGSEFVSGNYPGAVLMPVNLWGAVGKPGIHHIPTRTDLVTLLSLAGGPLGDAQIDSVTVKRRGKDGEQILKFDVGNLLDAPGAKSPILEANDIVIVPRDKPTVGTNTLATVSFVGSVLSVVLAALVLSNQLKNK